MDHPFSIDLLEGGESKPLGVSGTVPLSVWGACFTGFLQRNGSGGSASQALCPMEWRCVVYTTLQVEYHTDDIRGRSRVPNVQQGMGVETRNEATEQEGQGSHMGGGSRNVLKGGRVHCHNLRDPPSRGQISRSLS